MIAPVHALKGVAADVTSGQSLPAAFPAARCAARFDDADVLPIDDGRRLSDAVAVVNGIIARRPRRAPSSITLHKSGTNKFSNVFFKICRSL